jgi:hypothetical protein
MENAQFNTMVCKESVNLTGVAKKKLKKTGIRWRGIPLFMPGPFWGEGAGQNAIQCNTGTG